MKSSHICLVIGAMMQLTVLPVEASPRSMGQERPPLPVETIPSVSRLPDVYPKSWVLIHDLNQKSILDGRTLIVDTASRDAPLKGIVRTAQFGNMLFAQDRSEIVTAETFYSRLTRGTRTDAVTIWDSRTLEPKGEIVLPGGKRQQSTSYMGVFQFLNSHKWVAVTNFTPAQSVTIVDLDARAVLSEIDLPGCSHIYPTGSRGFTTFCADGSLTSIQLDEKGQVASSQTIASVQDIDNQPMFQNPAIVGQTAWFVTYRGKIKGFDLSGAVARPLSDTLSVGTADGGNPEWRPGGWQVISSDSSGLLYVLMNPAGKEGSHKAGGSEVWVIDPKDGKRINRITLPNGAFSIAVTQEDAPHLIAVRPESSVDVIDATTGALVRTLPVHLRTPLIVRTAP